MTRNCDSEPDSAGHFRLLGLYARHAEVKLVLQGAEESHLTPVVLGELLAGFFKGKNRLKNERELQAFLQSPRVNVANLDGETTRRMR